MKTRKSLDFPGFCIHYTLSFLSNKLLIQCFDQSYINKLNINPKFSIFLHFNFNCYLGIVTFAGKAQKYLTVSSETQLTDLPAQVYEIIGLSEEEKDDTILTPSKINLTGALECGRQAQDVPRG